MASSIFIRSSSEKDSMSPENAEEGALGWGTTGEEKVDVEELDERLEAEGPEKTEGLNGDGLDEDEEEEDEDELEEEDELDDEDELEEEDELLRDGGGAKAGRSMALPYRG
jgi:hypothetical protein